MLIISKLSNLVYDGIYEVKPQSTDKYIKAFDVTTPDGPGQYIGFQYPSGANSTKLVEFEWPLDTPALQFIMNLLIERVTSLNSNQPHVLKLPEGPYTYEQTGLFIKEAFDKLDSLDGFAIPDLTYKQTPGLQGQKKMKFYRELDAEFNKHSSHVM